MTQAEQVAIWQLTCGRKCGPYPFAAFLRPIKHPSNPLPHPILPRKLSSLIIISLSTYHHSIILTLFAHDHPTIISIYHKFHDLLITSLSSLYKHFINFKECFIHAIKYLINKQDNLSWQIKMKVAVFLSISSSFNDMLLIFYQFYLNLFLITESTRTDYLMYEMQVQIVKGASYWLNQVIINKHAVTD